MKSSVHNLKNSPWNFLFLILLQSSPLARRCSEGRWEVDGGWEGLRVGAIARLRAYNIQERSSRYSICESSRSSRREGISRIVAWASMKFISMLNATLAFGFSGFCIVPLYCARFHDFVHTGLLEVEPRDIGSSKKETYPSIDFSIYNYYFTVLGFPRKLYD